MSEQQNEMLSQMEVLLTQKLEAFEQSQRQFSQAQISRLQQTLGCNDTYTFRKKGNEEQSKLNVRVLDSLKAADGFIQDASRSLPASEALSSAQDKVSEGIDILNHRQKLIRLADSSDSGWRVVHEYEAHPLADNEDDEKKIYRAQMQADRKLRQERRSKGFRYSPYQRSKRYVSEQTTTTSNADNRGPSSSQPAWMQSSSGRKPGTCFRCGRSGHWRADCRVVLSDGQAGLAKDTQASQISNFMLFSSIDNATCENYESKISNVVTPVGKLKNNLKHWKDAGASQYMLQVVEEGYKLPFRNIPSSLFMKNNKSARDNPYFVSTEIKSLLSKGCISEVYVQPYIVNPLTVAYGKSGKARLVLDCRHINLELFKYKCCFEDQSVAKDLFEKGDYLISFDIRSAYHHIMIFPAHRTYLGFSWEIDGKMHFYVFNVLPFGISTAGYIFTKLLRVVVSKWRSLGYRCVLFLDDGIAGENSYVKALTMSEFIHSDLQSFGYIIAEDKCQWIPCQQLVWVGYVWDTLRGILMVTDERISKTEVLLQKFFDAIRQGKTIFPVRMVASLVGQLISMQSAIGQIVRLRTRSLYECVVSRASWEAPVAVSSRAFDEISFWNENLSSLNEKGLKRAGSAEDQKNIQNNVFCDASGAGFAGFIEGDDNSHVVGCWSETESGLSSTWRELETVHRVLNTSVKSLEGQNVVVNTDNKNVVSILKTGSKKQYLHDVAVDVQETCTRHNITLLPKWIPRAENQEADFYSRCTDSDDWAIEGHVHELLDKKWGPHTFDLFACNYNTKCNKFYSKYWCPGTSGIDALSFKWVNENFWLVPPPRLVAQCIKKIISDDCTCTMVVPVWRSAPFWPLLFPDGGKTSGSIHDHYIFSPGKLTRRGRGRNGIFDGRPLNFSRIAVRFAHE